LLFLIANLAGIEKMAPRVVAQLTQGRQLDRAQSINSWPSKAKRWALIIGVDQYRDAQINSLRGSVNDAHALANALVTYAGFPQDQVIVLTTDNSEERQPTRINILTYLSNLASLVPKDGLFLFSFAGHGIERGGQAFLIPSDARLSRDISLLEESAVSVSRMHDRIKAIGVGQVIVLLDACRNDPGGRAGAPNNMSEAYTKFNFDVRNREVEAFATLYATAVGQRAYEYTEKRQGYFTWAIVEALKGAAANEKGEVTLSALLKFVQDTVPKRIAIDLGASEQQKPFATIEGYRADDLVIAFVPPRGSPSDIRVESVYDLVADFSTTTNPKGAWSYGYISPGELPDTHTFKTYGWSGDFFNFWANEELKGLFAWRVPIPPGTPAGRDNPLGIYKNISTAKVSIYEPGELALHPGSGFYSAVCWTSPRTANYSIIGDFRGLDPKPTSTDVYIALNEKILWSDFVNDDHRPHQFGLTESISKGDRVYFIVGYGSNKSILNDTTGLSLKIVRQDSPNGSRNETNPVDATNRPAGDVARPKVDWDSLQPAGEKFSVMMPKSPLKESRRSLYHGWAVYRNVYRTQIGTRPFFAVISATGIESKATDTEKFDSYVDAFQYWLPEAVFGKGQAARLTLVREVNINGSSGREYTVSLSGTAGTARAYFMANRFYVTVALGGDNNELTGQFLESFRLR
jgi:hypothetical protein